MMIIQVNENVNTGTFVQVWSRGYNELLLGIKRWVDGLLSAGVEIHFENGVQFRIWKNLATG